MKSVFVAATSQNDGKTTLSLGLLGAFSQRGRRVGFFKPVGQRYKNVAEGPVDEDSLLVKSVYGIKDALRDMSPLAVERDFTRKYIDTPNVRPLEKRITDAYARISLNKDIVVIEGTGHGGVGAVFDLRNGRVAQMLGAKAIIVTLGGIGRPIDEICLNKYMYQALGVEVIGAVLNKVKPDKVDTVRKYVDMALDRNGMRLFGVIPEQPLLAGPTFAQLVEELRAKRLNGDDRDFSGIIENIIVGAMSSHNALSYLTNSSLIITPGDREDIILAAMTNWLMTDPDVQPTGGIVLTGGIRPHENILRTIRKTRIPVVLMQEDSYAVAGKVHDLKVKIQPADRTKIELAKKVVLEHVDVAAIEDAA